MFHWIIKHYFTRSNHCATWIHSTTMQHISWWCVSKPPSNRFPLLSNDLQQASYASQITSSTLPSLQWSPACFLSLSSDLQHAYTNKSSVCSTHTFHVCCLDAKHYLGFSYAALQSTKLRICNVVSLGGRDTLWCARLTPSSYVGGTKVWTEHEHPCSGQEYAKLKKWLIV